jgi:hypothetical protein
MQFHLILLFLSVIFNADAISFQNDNDNNGKEKHRHEAKKAYQYQTNLELQDLARFSEIIRSDDRVFDDLLGWSELNKNIERIEKIPPKNPDSNFEIGERYRELLWLMDIGLLDRKGKPFDANSKKEILGKLTKSANTIIDDLKARGLETTIAPKPEVVEVIKDLKFYHDNDINKKMFPFGNAEKIEILNNYLENNLDKRIREDYAPSEDNSHSFNIYPPERLETPETRDEFLYKKFKDPEIVQAFSKWRDEIYKQQAIQKDLNYYGDNLFQEEKEAYKRRRTISELNANAYQGFLRDQGIDKKRPPNDAIFAEMEDFCNSKLLTTSIPSEVAKYIEGKPVTRSNQEDQRETEDREER